MSDGSYTALASAADTLRDAIHAYAEARYQNYVTRLVSPRGAYEHACEDLAAFTKNWSDHERLALGYAHAEEINS